MAELPVAVVDKVVDKQGTRKEAESYLTYLWLTKGSASPPTTTCAAQPGDPRRVRRPLSERHLPQRGKDLRRVAQIQRAPFQGGRVFDQIHALQ